MADEPELHIGVEEGAPEYMLTHVGGALRLADGRIIIADRDNLELRFYDSKGRHLKSAGGRGQGPGEFEYLWSVLHCIAGISRSVRRRSTDTRIGRFP